MSTLVIGARGAVGRHVVAGLLAAGEPVRASARALSTAALPPGVDVVEADLTRPETLEPALDGVDQVFLYAAPGTGAGFAKAALAAGIRHVVVLSSGSVLLPWAAGNPITEEHRALEDDLAAAGLPVTPIRPLVLANNALSWAETIRAEGTVELVHPESRSAPIHERDIAAVAVAALTGAGGSAVSDLLTGPDLLTQRQQVDIVAAALGRPLRVVELTPDQARQRFGAYGDASTVEAVLAFIAAGTVAGRSPATGTARTVLGREPLPFTEWAREHAPDLG
ncbi:NAD(P)H-binding protein [Pseudonocardia sp. CA-107938]|uniref:NAD(P)H-binding protein n=1 Tax=Pseudonocardia sp. CA-107938 TaxID=3240021 RepID=UPI003D916544